MSLLNYKINFLPLELQGIALHKYRCLAVGTALLAVIFLCSCWMLAGRCTSLKSELVIVQKEIQDRAPAYKNAELIKKECAAAERLCQEYTAIISRRQEWSKMLIDLNRIAPADLWLVELEIGEIGEIGSQQQKTDSKKESSEKELFGKKIIMKGNTGDLSAVGVFLIELGKLPYFQQLALDNVTCSTGGMSFQITASVKEVK
jgi:Tfp pilus assembly protein PilN